MKKSTKILIAFFGALLLMHICAVICIPTISLDGSRTADDNDTIVQYRYFFEEEVHDDELDSIAGSVEDRLDVDR